MDEWGDDPELWAKGVVVVLPVLIACALIAIDRPAPHAAKDVTTLPRSAPASVAQDTVNGKTTWLAY